MTTAVALWSQILTPGKQYTFDSAVDLQITNASLDETATGSERTVVKLRYIDENDESAVDDDEEEDDDDDEIPGVDKEIVLTTLTPGKCEQTSVNLILAENESGYTFSVVGPNKVHLAGHYLIQHGKHPADSDSEGDYDSEDDDGEGGIYDDEVGLLGAGDSDDDDEDDEDEEDDAERFQELPSPGKSLKRSRPSEADDDLGDVSMATTTSVTSTSLPATVDGVDVSTLSKNQRKKLAKKLKTDDGSAAAPAAAAETAKLGKHEVSKEKAAAPAAAVPAKEKEDKKAPSKKTTLPSGVTIEDAKIGSGPIAKAGSKVSMRYIGSLPGGKVFDKNTKGKPFEFKLGAGQVIKGWDDGIKGMAIGGERKLIIPPASGYGKKGAPPDIPPNATLHFEVKLLGIK